jgi:hypothetical protein
VLLYHWFVFGKGERSENLTRIFRGWNIKRTRFYVNLINRITALGFWNRVPPTAMVDEVWMVMRIIFYMNYYTSL